VYFLVPELVQKTLELKNDKQLNNDVAIFLFHFFYLFINFGNNKNMIKNKISVFFFSNLVVFLTCAILKMHQN